MTVKAFFIDPIEGWFPVDTLAAGWEPDTFMSFPAGERHVTEGNYPFEVTNGFVLIQGTNANDYVSAAMWIDLMHQRGVKVAAMVPYLPGARQDRGRPLGAKVYADLINAMGADQVISVDPHSPVMPALIHNRTIVPLENLLRGTFFNNKAKDYVGVICPDEGAIERSSHAADVLGLPLYQARKHRDFKTGTLSGFSCEPLPGKGRLLVFDDICDRGGTFMGLADATGLPPERLDLWVTHGVFSGNPTSSMLLRQRFGDIYTTDSHPGHTNSYINAIVRPLILDMFQEIKL